jgi:signal transduction histidine kinase
VGLASFGEEKKMTREILTSDELNRLLAMQSPDETEFFTPPPDSPLLRLLASIDRATLNQLTTEHTPEPGEIICYEGERGEAMYLIRSGKVVVVKGSLESPMILAYRGPGELIGEMALLENQPRSATNIALDNVRLIRINRESFQEWVSGNPAIGMTIMATLSARLRASDDVRASALQGGRQLVQQVSRLQTEKEQLLELQRVRQETSDLVVHDLRNPLGTIYGALSMLEMVLPEDILRDNRELLDLATTACERMQRLVDSLLDVAKLETGEVLISMNSVDLRPVLIEAVQRQSLTLRMRGIVIEVEVPDSLPTVLIDSEKIERVLANLLDNAIKYSPNDAPIVLAAKAEADRVVVSVTDAGPGIPPDERERIFERFAQVSGQTGSRRGFGLGLTFCRLAIEGHGGRIWVEPGPNGRGSSFLFTLPLSPDQT